MTTPADQTPGSKDIDREVAEKVMGWKWYTALRKSYLVPPFAHEYFDSLPSHWTPEKAGVVSSIEVHYSKYGHMAIQRFSTDIAAAWQVVEKMLADDALVALLPQPPITLADEPDEPWCCVVRAGGGQKRVYAATAPLAICLAALSVIIRP